MASYYGDDTNNNVATGYDYLSGGKGNDSLGSNTVGYNYIEGGEGNDYLYLHWNSTAYGALYGGGGNDWIQGGTGADQLDGGAGDDYIQGGSSNAAGGADRLSGGDGRDALYGYDGDDVLIGGAGDDSGSDITVAFGSVYYPMGNTVAPGLYGGAGNDYLDGGDGNDRLDGGIGADTMIGGMGDDVFIVDDLGDKVFEADGAGNDTVGSSVSFSVANQFIETVVLTGTASINAVGNALANTLVGNDGNNALGGGAGADLMEGGKGNDTYYVDNAGDRVYESNETGIDLVYSAVSFSAATQFIENITLTGVGNTNAVGNSLANTLVGNAGNNAFDGRTGADTMRGLGGNDTYVVDNVNDRIIEIAGGGSDTVYTSVSRSFADSWVETIRLTDSAANATGNAAVNTMIGNNLGNGLNGREGSDVLYGGLGKDAFVFNTKLGASNIDQIADFNVTDDTIQLENAIFTKLGSVGTLTSTLFAANAAGTAQDANDHIIYETDTGNIYYDTNGNAAGGSTLFAKVGAGLPITAADFLVI